MDSWVVAFVGLIALGSLVQVGFLVTLAVVGLKVARRTAVLRGRAMAELEEPLRHLSAAAGHVKDISQIVSEEARTLRDGAHAAADEMRAAKDDVRRVIRSPWVEVAALSKGVSRAVEVFRATPSAPPPAR